MKKIVFVIALAMCMVFAFSSFAMVVTKPTDSVQWNSGAKCNPALSINANTATCSLYVKAQNSPDSITTTVMLQKKNSDGTYSNVTTWSKITGKGSVNFVDKYSPVYPTSYTYRVKAIVYVTGSGGTDTITRFAY